MQYRLWSVTFGLACWLATHGPRLNGERLSLPIARQVMRASTRLWREEFSPDW